MDTKYGSQHKLMLKPRGQLTSGRVMANLASKYFPGHQFDQLYDNTAESMTTTTIDGGRRGVYSGSQSPVINITGNSSSSSCSQLSATVGNQYSNVLNGGVGSQQQLDSQRWSASQQSLLSSSSQITINDSGNWSTGRLLPAINRRSSLSQQPMDTAVNNSRLLVGINDKLDAIIGQLKQQSDTNRCSSSSSTIMANNDNNNKLDGKLNAISEDMESAKQDYQRLDNELKSVKQEVETLIAGDVVDKCVAKYVGQLLDELAVLKRQLLVALDQIDYEEPIDWFDEIQCY